MRQIWPVLRETFAPVRHTSNLLGWWPVFVAVLASALGVVGIKPPDRIDVPQAAWFVIALALVCLMFLRSATRFYEQSHPTFPAHRIAFERPWRFQKGDTDYVMVNMEYTNRELQRAVVLNVRPQWVGEEPHRTGMGPYNLHLERLSGFEHALSFPLTVQAMENVEGFLVLDGNQVVFKDTDPGDIMANVLLRPDWRCFVEIEDHISGATTTEPLPFPDEPMLPP